MHSAITKTGVSLLLLALTACSQMGGASQPDLPAQVEQVRPAKKAVQNVASETQSITPLQQMKQDYAQLQQQTKQLEERLSQLQFQQEQQQEQSKKLQKQWETNFSLMEHSVSKTIQENQQQLDVLQQMSLNQLKEVPAEMIPPQETPSQKRIPQDSVSQKTMSQSKDNALETSPVIPAPPVIVAVAPEMQKAKAAPGLQKAETTAKVATKPLKPKVTAKRVSPPVEIAAPAVIAASQSDQKQTKTEKNIAPKKKEKPQAIETYSLFAKKSSPKKRAVVSIAPPQDLYALNSSDAIDAPLPLRPPPEGRILDERKNRPSAKKQPVIPLAPPVPLPEESNFNDPDLRGPKNPVQVKRRSGVKRMYNTGMAAIILQDYREAVKIFTRFTDKFSDDINSDNAYYWIGHAYYKLGKTDEAEQAFRNVLRNYEHHSTAQGYKTPDAIYMLGKVYEARQDISRSSYYFREVIDQYPSSAAARNALKDMRRFRR